MKRPFIPQLASRLAAAFVFVLLIALSAAPRAAFAQEALTEEAIRARIAQMGLTPEQVRQRLQAAGVAPSALDAYLKEGKAPAAGPDIVKALEALTPPPAAPQGLEPTPPPAAPNAGDPPANQADRVFGADIFRRSSSQFQPLLTGPAPATYRIGPGDLLVVVITGDVEFVHNLEVTREGFIVIPQVGQIFVNGVTMGDLKGVLRSRVARVYGGIEDGTTRLDVSLAKLRTNQIYVVGEAMQPAAYQLSSVATVLNALYASGGPNDRGSFRKIEVRRNNAVIATFDVYDYLLHGDTRRDVTLENGDIVFIPAHGPQVTVRGAVVRPATYELAANEDLRQVIGMAGGFRPDAAALRVSVSRVTPPEQRTPGGLSRIVIDVPLSGNALAGSFALKPSDVVTAFDVPEAVRATVQLKGSVFHGGEYGWRPGMKLSELIRVAGGFKPATYAGRAHIERLNAEDNTRYLIPVQLPEQDGVWPQDVALNEFDVITIYNRDDFRAGRKVGISGMVNKPGDYEYREGMTLRDLVLMAGGLRDGAYLDTAEIARLPLDRSQGQLATVARVPMDETYRFEPDSTSYRFLPTSTASSKGSTSATVPLMPFDQVLILKAPNFEMQRMVQISGEVKFPGTYALTRKDERLTDLVARAGGLQPNAFVRGARFTRPTGNAGRVDVRLRAALENPGGEEDLVLQPGDELVIPEFNAVVQVQGAVNSPTSVLYKEGADLDYYIENAGGYARGADKRRVHIRFADGTARVAKSHSSLLGGNPEPGPGSVVTVPLTPEEDRFKWKDFIGGFGQIVGTLGALIAIIATR
jgi:polysaccharide biosynthesis/export protein